MSIVLCIAPHPDDETLGCGGTLLRHKADGDELHWLIMTTMEGSEDYSRENIKQRSIEIKKVSEAYGFETLHQTNFTTAKLDTVPLKQLVSAVSNHFSKIKPEIIYSPFRGDIHSDHRIVADTVAASSKSFRHPYIRTIRCYETLSETEFSIGPYTNHFIPNLWIDISDYIETKLNIMKIYKGEMDKPPFPRSRENLRSLSRYRGSTVHCNYAEAFMILKELI